MPVGTLAGAAGKEPSAAGPVKSCGAHVEEEDYDEDYYYEDGMYILGFLTYFNLMITGKNAISSLTLLTRNDQVPMKEVMMMKEICIKSRSPSW